MKTSLNYDMHSYIIDDNLFIKLKILRKSISKESYKRKKKFLLKNGELL